METEQICVWVCVRACVRLEVPHGARPIPSPVISLLSRQALSPPAPDICTAITTQTSNIWLQFFLLSLPQR
jgi:hypothetical protein